MPAVCSEKNSAVWMGRHGLGTGDESVLQCLAQNHRWLLQGRPQTAAGPQRAGVSAPYGAESSIKMCLAAGVVRGGIPNEVGAP